MEQALAESPNNTQQHLQRIAFLKHAAGDNVII